MKQELADRPVAPHGARGEVINAVILMMTMSAIAAVGVVLAAVVVVLVAFGPIGLHYFKPLLVPALVWTAGAAALLVLVLAMRARQQRL